MNISKIKQQLNPTLAFFMATTIFVVGFAPQYIFAQESSLSLTITPPLFQFTATPGDVWNSSLKVINSNPYGISVYATPVDFVASGEKGQGTFKPLFSEEISSSTHSLGNWIDISSEPIFIPREQSMSIPFSVKVPEQAEPGGHYAAILVGQQPSGALDGPTVKISSFISSLLFVRISGDIVEKGSIREFSTEKSFYQTPRSSFVLRFENSGNVHLLPQGDIVIYNMWGKERGRIPIHHQMSFGNVLPESIREFSFEWGGEQNFFDVGRYRAIATLSYGNEEKQTDYRTLYFWVIPVKPVLWIGGSLLFFILFVVWALRRYVKRALFLEAEALMGGTAAGSLKEAKQKKAVSREKEAITPNMKVLARPLVQGVVDLRSVGDSASVSASQNTSPVKHLKLAELLKKYKLFLLFIAIFIAGCVLFVVFFDQVMMHKRGFEIRVKKDTSEEISVSLPDDIQSDKVFQ